MLTEEDIKKLIEVFATREEIALKSDYDDLRKDFASLQTAVDGYAKKADIYFQEMLMLSRRVDRHEKWIKQIPDKLGVSLDY